MFVFKAAVVGAGTMGGEIAQAIAAAEIPVVLKDTKQEFVEYLDKYKSRDGHIANLCHHLGGVLSMDRPTDDGLLEHARNRSERCVGETGS